MWIYLIIYVSWLLKLWIHPQPATSLSALIANASCYTAPGWLIFILFTGWNVLLFALIVWVGLRRSVWGEIQEPKKGFTLLRDDQPERLADLFRESIGEGECRHRNSETTG